MSAAEENLPTVLHSCEVNFLGYKLIAHVLSNGQRVYEDTPELRRLLADMTGHEMSAAIARLDETT